MNLLVFLFFTITVDLLSFRGIINYAKDLAMNIAEWSSW